MGKEALPSPITTLLLLLLLDRPLLSNRPLGQNAGCSIARLRSSAAELKPNPNSVPEFDPNPNPSLTITPFCIYILRCV